MSRPYGLQVCSKGHETLVFHAASCPLCEALKRTQGLLTASQEVLRKRCAECQKRPPVNGREVKQ